jgi:DNA invertase Pin-like site-specific DNA recombinase
MTAIGYARVSTTDQDLSIQEAALRVAGCEVIRAEKRSGTTTEGREELRTVLDFLRRGDVLRSLVSIGSPAASATFKISSAA